MPHSRPLARLPPPLLRLKGVGATVLVRFAHRRQGASYLALARGAAGPSAAPKAKAGRPADRIGLVVAAASERAGQRTGTTKGRWRRILVVALARKLMVALWRYLTDGVVPEGDQSMS